MEKEPTDKVEQKANSPEILAEPEFDESLLPTPFKYKAIAAVLLIVPFGFMIDWGQTLFLSMDWEYISKMTVLIGLILYIVAVGKVAKKFQNWHENRKS